MPKWPTLVLCTVSLNAWPLVARAQGDGAPVPAQPEPPSAPVEPPAAAPPPAEPSPAPAPGMEPPSAPAPAPPSITPPPSAAFPPPPSSQPTAKQAPPKTAGPPPAALEPPPSTPAPSTEKPRPERATQGLFDEKRPPSDVRHHEDEADKDEGTDQFKIGPVVGVGLPSVLSFGGTMKVTRFLGAGVNIGLIPTVQLSYYGDATLSYQHYDIYGRIYPFGGGFFLSGGAGYATVKGTLKTSYTAAAGAGVPFSGTVDYDGHGSVRTLMLTALIGYFYTTSIGFSIGVDAGAQIPIAPSTIDFGSSHSVTTTIPNLPPATIESAAAPYISKGDQSIRDTLEKIGRTTLPTLNLRIGWIL